MGEYHIYGQDDDGNYSERGCIKGRVPPYPEVEKKEIPLAYKEFLDKTSGYTIRMKRYEDIDNETL